MKFLKTKYNRNNMNNCTFLVEWKTLKKIPFN